jgi:hypothetical protein
MTGGLTEAKEHILEKNDEDPILLGSLLYTFTVISQSCRGR